jgi:hypothetical protein
MSFRNVISDKGGRFRTGLDKISPSNTPVVIDSNAGNNSVRLFRNGLGKSQSITTVEQSVIEIVRPQLFRNGLGKSSPIVTTTTQPVIEVVRPQLFRTGLGKRDGGSAIAPTLWTPAQITTDVWLDASSLSNFDLASPNKISQWYDLSGNNRHAQQFTDSSRPLYATNQYVIFDGIDDGLIVGNGYSVSSRSANNKVAFFMVCRIKLIDSTYRAVFSNDGSSGGYQRGIGMANGVIATQGGSGSNDIQNTSNPQGSFVIGAISDYPNNYYLSLNGTLTAKGASETGAGTAGLPLSIGLGYPTSTGGNSQNFNGDISEFVAISGTLSTDIRQKIEGYLAHKWNTKAYLPSDHPYKNSAPTA